MNFKRFVFVVVCALVASLSSIPIGRAQEYPSRSITLIAPWPAGGAIDALCRAVAPKLSERLGQSIVVENRPGAGSVLGTAAGAKAPPDGYTLAMAGSGSLAIGPTLFKALPYDPAKDFAPVALVGFIPFVLVVNPALPVHSIAELVSYAKTNPSSLSYGSGGPGSPHHLYAELLKSMTGIEMTHVPYKGSAPALTDVVAGHVQLLFSDTVPSLPLIREGRVRALGVSSTIRLPSAPEIPPLAEAGVPGFDAAGWGMIVAPANTRPAIIERLHREVKTIAALPEIADQIIRLGMVPVQSASPAKLQEFIDTEMTRWGKVVRAAGLAGTE
jgi:tripartite-type tricarboxylate transporter receptor subunit TctC